KYIFGSSLARSECHRPQRVAGPDWSFGHIGERREFDLGQKNVPRVYRLENEWEVFDKNPATIQISSRPVIDLRKWHDFLESRSHGFRYLGTLDFLGLNTPEFKLDEAAAFCDIDLSGTLAGYNWGHV